MSPKAIFVFCAQALLAQSVFSACGGNCGGYSLGGCNGFAGGYGGMSGGYGSGYGCRASGVASSGGGLPVSSVSPFAPTGISVVSENVLEGELIASGNLPFLGAVALDGAFPSGGNGAVSYGCGDGAVTISREAPVATEYVAPSVGYVNQGISGYGGVAGYGLGGAAGCGPRGISGYGQGGASYGCGGRGCSCGY